MTIPSGNSFDNYPVADDPQNGTIPVRNLPSGRALTDTGSGGGRSKARGGPGFTLPHLTLPKKRSAKDENANGKKPGSDSSERKPSPFSPLKLEAQKKLSALEAGAMRETLYRAMKEIWRYADEGLSLTNKAGVKVGQDVPAIWRSIDREETLIIVDAMLRAAMANPYVAVAVRGITDAYKQLEIGIILVPRFLDTWRFYAQFGFGASPDLPGVGGRSK
jgi:hypothetical protein